MKPIPYGKQHLTEKDLEAVREVLLSDYLTGGPRIAAFEQAFASYIGAQYAVTVSSGTAALHLCALALDVTTGSRVLRCSLRMPSSHPGSVPTTSRYMKTRALSAWDWVLEKTFR